MLSFFDVPVFDVTVFDVNGSFRAYLLRKSYFCSFYHFNKSIIQMQVFSLYYRLTIPANVLCSFVKLFFLFFSKSTNRQLAIHVNILMSKLYESNEE